VPRVESSGRTGAADEGGVAGRVEGVDSSEAPGAEAGAGDPTRLVEPEAVTVELSAATTPDGLAVRRASICSIMRACSTHTSHKPRY
jgi:hypothetical protein